MEKRKAAHTQCMGTRSYDGKPPVFHQAGLYRAQTCGYRQLQGGKDMLRLSVTKNEYLMIGKDVRLTFLGSNDRSLKIMIDAPKEVNIARGKAIEKRAMEQEMAADRDWFD